jgi:hypothetical protein
MKKLFFLTMLFFCNFFTNAQSFSTDKDSVILYNATSASDLESKVHYYNNASGNISIDWSITDVVLPSSWSIISICDNKTCYSYDKIGIKYTTNTTLKNDSSFIKLLISIPSTQQKGVAKISMKLEEPIFNTVKNVFFYYSSKSDILMALNELKNDEWISFLNGKIEFSSSLKNQIQTIETFDMLGNKALVDNLNHSVLFIKVLLKDGRSITKKICR